jgi:uncharacterized membrane protein YeaQ/YmgE (transglycosylase-associated protein family)
MSLILFASLFVIAGVTAAIGQTITGYSRGGCPVAFVVAFVGAYLGPYAAEALGFTEPVVVPLGPEQVPLVTSTAAALILVIIVNLVTRKRKF